MVCRYFILPEGCKPCLFYLRNLLYLISSYSVSYDIFLLFYRRYLLDTMERTSVPLATQKPFPFNARIYSYPGFVMRCDVLYKIYLPPGPIVAIMCQQRLYRYNLLLHNIQQILIAFDNIVYDTGIGKPAEQFLRTINFCPFYRL